MLQFLHDTVPVRALVVSHGSQFWLIGEKGDGQEGPRSAHGVDGKAGGAGLLWGLELVFSLLRRQGKVSKESPLRSVTCLLFG